MKRKPLYEKADDMRDVKSVYRKRQRFELMKKKLRLEELLIELEKEKNSLSQSKAKGR